ncbi:YebC/PmpR family DNA-binding transcriptional regulator [Pseudalkalibacillus berkeleyi]|uniref:Probable transcriptional regulatory protein L2716_10125 n=1 Tax=Pseudalkalibacillus berkeleyi TaxID=1069813 RepID=A0ABS9H2M3_9BACL|nr:YebC/PmpR family DNA-binding transcriptional regulator [Pseudalkalibacillus berkeleyi]MCF6138080.1 YebC/PmpR family DNA-binding transcriptional regulator [Pseudalkalibacillus berkeleyi]
MAGHSKWKNIQRRKNAQDAKRGKVFMKLAKDIYVAAKEGGGDPETNPSLRLMIEKAKSANMPNENIDRAVRKATGNLDGVSYEEIIYEGYGAGGTAIMVEILTDNKNRTAADVRHAFSKNDGNLGETGCVSFMFDRKGIISINREEVTLSEDDFMLEVIECGGEEYEVNEDTFDIYTEPDMFKEVKDQLVSKGYSISTSEMTMIPQTFASLGAEDTKKVLNLIDTLEDLDDVQEVFHNLEVDEEEYEEYVN